MPSPYPPVPYQLETALLVTLRDTFPWQSSVATANASGTYSGTLTPVATELSFNAAQYQRRDRELAWLDTRNAAAVVQVALEVADVWNAEASKPLMQGPQISHLNYSPYDVAPGGSVSKVVHVRHASIPIEAIATDRDLASRDLLIYDVLYQACQNLFTVSPIESPMQDKDGQPLAYTTEPVTAWSYASGTQRMADIATVLPLNRDLFRDADVNLADRDNQLAGYVTRLCQVLKNPFSYANRLYVKVNGWDAREVDVYTLIYPVFELGRRYAEGSEIYYQDVCYRVKAGVGTTSDEPWTSPWAWEVAANPRQRLWACEPHLPYRNRIVYDTEESMLQWFREGGTEVHLPQLFALSIPGLFPAQTLQTLASVPERKDGHYWRNKAAHLVPAGGTHSTLSSYSNTAGVQTFGFTSQFTGASFTVPSFGTVRFADPSTGVVPMLVPQGWYRLHALVEPNAVVDRPGGANTAAVSGTLGGVTFGSYGRVSWDIGLPPTQWTVEFDYTNLASTTEGFRIYADLDGSTVFDDTSPFYFNDTEGQALPNGQLLTSVPFPIFPSGGRQILTFNWTGGGGNLHIRAIRFKSEAYASGHYKMSGTAFGSVASVNVIGAHRQPDTLYWDFYAKESGMSTDCYLRWERETELPIRFLAFELTHTGSNIPTPNSQGYEPYRNDCLMRAYRSAQQAYVEALASGTEMPTFMDSGSSWGTQATEDWMAFIETREPRLRQIDNVASGDLQVGLDYEVKYQPVTYEGNTIQPGATFRATTTTTYSWPGSSGAIHQVGAWLRSLPSHVGRPGLAPAGVYFDTNGGTLAVAYGPERSQPELVALQPWMVYNGFYAAQPEFWLPFQQ